MLKSRHVRKMSKCRLIIVIFTGFKVPPRAVRLVVAACGASATSEKTRPWIFGACILWILSFFVDFIEIWTSFTEKCVKFTKLYSKMSFLELARGARGATGASGSGVSKCCSDPPFHTRRGSGWRELNKLPQNRAQWIRAWWNTARWIRARWNRVYWHGTRKRLIRMMFSSSSSSSFLN